MRKSTTQAPHPAPQTASQKSHLAPMPCLADLSTLESQPGILANTLPGIDDDEGAALPADCPRVIDAHVHLFPDGVFDAIWKWFRQYGWPIRYPLYAQQTIDFLVEHNVEHIVGLCYAHKPGMARALNAYMAELQERNPRLTGLGTVLPGEADARDIVDEAFRLGLGGLKLHCHVQAFSPDDDNVDDIYAACCDWDRPLVMHAGREPKSDAYPVDPHQLCAYERVEDALRRFPKLRLIVPHIGADEFTDYLHLVERYDGLYLDTTMMLADYFSLREDPLWFVKQCPQRMLYGTDFPNLPYAWDRELRRLLGAGLNDEELSGVLANNAVEALKLTRAETTAG